MGQHGKVVHIILTQHNGNKEIDFSMLDFTQ